MQSLRGIREGGKMKKLFMAIADYVENRGKKRDGSVCQKAVKEQIALLEDQIAHPEKYPELFEKDIALYLDENSEVRILSKYYRTLDVLKAVDPDMYKSLVTGFLIDVLPGWHSPVMENLQEQLEILKEDISDKTEV